jgi:hypothetical protein
MPGMDKLGEFVPLNGIPIPRWLAVLGSTGQPRDGDPAACRALLDADARSITGRRVPYDQAGAALRIREAGLPKRFAARLETGSRQPEFRPVRTPSMRP